MKTRKDAYLEMLRVRHYSPGTIKSRAMFLRLFFAHLQTIGVDDLRAVSRQSIENYQRELLRHYSVNTTRQHIGTLRSFFAHLENTDAILLDPTAGVPLAKQERRLPNRILKPSEVRRLLAAPDATPKSIRNKAMLELFYSSGIRRAEMARLTVQDVDIKNGFVRITRGKGARDRVVPIGQSACDALGDYLKNARNAWMKVRRVKTWTDALWLSPIQPHLPVQTEAIGLIVNLHAKRVLGRNVSPHLWRHTFATHLVSNGANIVYVQRLLGHKSLKTTDIYTRVTMSDLKKTLQRTHPRNRRAAAPPPALTRAEAAQMPGGNRWQKT